MRMHMLRLFLFLCQHHKSMKILSGRARICGISPITSPPCACAHARSAGFI
jgi:hypothetical protein